jgi:hypothetical protein
MFLTPIVKFVDFGPIAVFDIHRQFCQFRAHRHHWHPLPILSISGSSPSSTSIVNLADSGLPSPTSNIDLANFGLIAIVDFKD